MIRNRARLVVAGNAGRTTVITAAAEAPQRWTPRLVDGGRTVDAVHQVIGDGMFGGERYATSITARRGASLVVRAIAATPLRREEPSVSVVHIRAASGATVLYLPGALIPQAGSAHTSILRVDAAEDARVLVAAVITPGRLGMGEYGQFAHLRLRTVVRYDSRLALAEDATLAPSGQPLQSRAMFSDGQAALSLTAIGRWPPASAAWWTAFDRPGVAGGAQPLRCGGVAYRGLSETLGDAVAFVAQVETAARIPG